MSGQPWAGRRTGAGAGVAAGIGRPSGQRQLERLAPRSLRLAPQIIRARLVHLNGHNITHANVREP